MQGAYRLEKHEKRDIAGGWDKFFWIRRARMFLVPPLCWIYAEKNGGPVLKEEAHWQKISGFQVHVGTWQLWLHWRRWK